MGSGRVKMNTPACELLSVTPNVYVSSKTATDGQLLPGTFAGQHVAEYKLYKTGQSNVYTITYWRPGSTLYSIAWYDANHNLIKGRKGNSGGALTGNYWFPDGTVYVRIYGIYREGDSTYNVNASMVYTGSDSSVYGVEEIRVRAEGDTASQIVWPLFENWVISAATLDVNGSVRYDGEWVMRPDGQSYCYATGTVQHRRGTTVIETFTNVPLTATAILYNSTAQVDGETKTVFKIGTRNNRSVVLGLDMKTTLDTGGFSADVIFSYQGLATTTLTVKQAPNTATEDGYADQTTLGYILDSGGVTELGTSGGTVTFAGYYRKSRTPRYQWTSYAYSYGAPQVYLEAALSGVTVDSHGATAPTIGTVSNNQVQITFPPNGNADENYYTVKGYYSVDDADVNISVKGTETGRTYSNLRVDTFSYPVVGSGSTAYSIPAGGGGVWPTIVIKLDCTINGVTGTLTGEVGQGEVLCTVSGTVGGQSVATTVSITYYGSNNGYVSAQSRGTNVDSARTVVASGVYVRVTKNGVSAATSSSLTIYQQRNERWIASGDAGTFTLQSLTVTPTVNGTALATESGRFMLNNANQVQVYVDVRATGSGRATKYTYTALLPDGVTHVTSGGEALNLDNAEVNPPSLSLSVKVGQTPISLTGKTFLADNRHVEQIKDYTITASYESSGDISVTMRQKADQKVDTGEPTYHIEAGPEPGSNTLSAAGGEVLIRVSVYYTVGLVWESDGYEAESGGERHYDPDKIAVVETVNEGYERSLHSTTEQWKVFRYRHRDMKNFVTTDHLSLYASVPGVTDTSDNPMVYSVSNALVTTQTYSVYGDVVYGEVYAEPTTYYISFAIDDYTNASSPAPFNQQSVTTYRTNGYHLEALYHDGTQLIYRYQRYASWTSSTDDDEHRELIGVTEDTETYRHQYVGERSVAGDPVLVTRRHPADTWATLDTTNHTITIAAQVDSENGTPPRWTGFDAVNTADPAYSDGNPDTNPATADKSVYQQAYSKIVPSTQRINIRWEGGSGEIDLNAWYAQFKVSSEGSWMTASMSTDGGITYVAVDPNTVYGNSSGARSLKLRVASRTPNDEEHNPSGYQEVRIASITLVPQNSPGVSSVRIQIIQEAYDGGLPNT